MKLSTIAATAAAAAITATAFATLPATAAASPACRPAQLHLTLGHERANTGHVTWTLTALDKGPACILPAFPKLGLEDAAGRPLHSVTAHTGKAGGGLLLHGLAATAGISYGSDGQAGEAAAFLAVGAGRVAFPGGIALVYGGQISTTSWKV